MNGISWKLVLLVVAIGGSMALITGGMLLYFFPLEARTYGTQEGWLVVMILAVLVTLFVLVFRWSQRNEQASYLGTVFREGVFDFELTRRTRRVEEKHHEFRRAAELAISYPKRPEVPAELRRYLRETGFVPSAGNQRPGGTWSGSGLPSGGRPSGGGGTLPPGGGGAPPPGLLRNSSDEWRILSIDPDALPDKWKKLKDVIATFTKEWTEFEGKVEKWEADVWNKTEEQFQGALKEAREKAEAAANSAADVDMAVFRGRGPTFVLEFTAIVVIIFAAVILAILSRDGIPDQVWTLLAAIAGYVLGRATTRGADSERRGTRRRQEPGTGQTDAGETPGQPSRRARSVSTATRRQADAGETPGEPPTAL